MAGVGGSGRVSDLHKSAFWIYGVTAMVMREPLMNAIRHTAAGGIGDPGVQVEVLRVAAILSLMARQFLASGLYFDQVHLRPDSAAAYPRRSYPVDFLAGLLQFLLVVGASTVIPLDGPFAALVGAFLLFEIVWLAVSALLGLSTVARIAPLARIGALTFALCAAAHLAPGRLVPPAVVLVMTWIECGRLVREY